MCADELRGRQPELEWLRVIAMGAVFIAHTAHVFTPWQYWHIQNAERSTLFGQLTLFVWPWVMPLFMLLAGAAAAMSLRRRGDRDFCRERTRRLVVPFVFGVLVLLPPQVWVERLAQGRFQGNLLRFYPHFFECCYPEGNLAAGHLWFIGYLWLYSIALLPLLRRLSLPASREPVASIARLMTRPGGFLLPVAPFLITQLALRGVFPQSLDLITDWANHAFLILAYLYGALLVRPELQAAVQAHWRPAMATAAAASVLLAAYAARAGAAAAVPQAYTSEYFVFWTLFSVASSGWMLGWIGLARRHLRATPPAVARLARATFPIYLLHQTVIVLFAYVVVQFDWTVLPKFIVLLAASAIVTSAMSALMARSTTIAKLLGARLAMAALETASL